MGPRIRLKFDVLTRDDKLSLITDSGQVSDNSGFEKNLRPNSSSGSSIPVGGSPSSIILRQK